jgi:hypothetical protein
MHFSQAVAIIQSQVGIIKGVQVLYSDTVRIRFILSKLDLYKSVEVHVSFQYIMHISYVNRQFFELMICVSSLNLLLGYAWCKKVSCRK